MFSFTTMEINRALNEGKESQNSTIAVIGGGPAGLISCFWLQKFGIPHLLIEKQEYPRDKACADILTSNAIRRINEINSTYIPEMIEMGLLRPIHGTDFITPNHNTINLKYKFLDNIQGTPSCYSIKRSDLDNFLYQKLILSPLTKAITGYSVKKIEVEKEGCRISGSRGESFYASLVMVATGSNFNPLEKKRKTEDIHTAVGIQAYYRGIESKLNDSEFFLMPEFMPGAFYISPLEKDLFNVNMVFRGDVVRKKGADLKVEFEKFIQTNESVRERFRKAERVSDFTGSRLILGTKKRTICGDRYMFLGDSAGLIDLITANGIPQAMLSGRLAAEQAKKCIMQQDFSKEALMEYQTTLQHQIKKDVAVGKTVNPFLKYSWIHKVLISIFNFLSHTSSRNSSLIKILYSDKPASLLINPFFYYNLFKESALAKKPVRE